MSVFSNFVESQKAEAAITTKYNKESALSERLKNRKLAEMALAIYPEHDYIREWVTKRAEMRKAINRQMKVATFFAGSRWILSLLCFVACIIHVYIAVRLIHAGFVAHPFVAIFLSVFPWLAAIVFLVPFICRKANEKLWECEAEFAILNFLSAGADGSTCPGAHFFAEIRYPFGKALPAFFYDGDSYQLRDLRDLVHQLATDICAHPDLDYRTDCVTARKQYDELNAAKSTAAQTGA